MERPVIQYLHVESFNFEGGVAMMYDPLALDRQRQDQENLRRRSARGPVPSRGPKPPREAHRRYAVLRRLTTAISSS
jgi:hypothetical protein